MQGVASLGPARASAFMNLFPLITALMAIGILAGKNSSLSHNRWPNGISGRYNSPSKAT